MADCREAPGDEKYLVCNADEGDPGAWVNRTLLEGDPHLILEGLMIASRASGAREAYIYVRHEYPLAIERLELAVRQAHEKGLLGENILGLGWDFDIVVFRGAGSYVCGDETGLINSIDGYRGMHRIKPPFPAQSGLWNKPTNVNNVESYANAPLILPEGAAWWNNLNPADPPILGRIDIVEVISGYIPLKRAGRNFKAACPFHHEKTPSFMVSPDRQIYHCFGCGESGNAFKFLMRHERLEFPEALEVLAGKAGVVLPVIQKQDTKSAGITTLLYKINELAALFYENNLHSPEGLRAKDYLLKRGIRAETIKVFKLGLASDKWDGLINNLRAKNCNLSALEKAGLILSRDGGGYYDRFRSRPCPPPPVCP